MLECFSRSRLTKAILHLALVKDKMASVYHTIHEQTEVLWPSGSCIQQSPAAANNGAQTVVRLRFGVGGRSYVPEKLSSSMSSPEPVTGLP